MIQTRSNAWRAHIRQALVVTALATSLLIAASGQAQSADANNELHLPVMLATSASATAAPNDAGAQYVPGEILVGIRRDAVGAAAVAEEVGAEAIATFGPEDDVNVTGYVLRVTPGTELQRIAALAKNPAVAYAEPNWIVRAADTEAAAEIADAAAETPFRVNDPLYRTWQWHLPRIHASRGWALSGAVSAQTADAGPILVAVIDSGVDTHHPDLKKNVELWAKNYVDPGQLPEDDCGHGTHIIGLLGATTNNGTGIAGVATDVTVVPFKTLRWARDANDNLGCIGQVSWVVQAIYDAADAGVAGYDIINLSLELSQPSASLEAAVNYARNRGVLLIAAGGNSSPVKYPAAYPAVMAIAATGYYDSRAYYSAVGPQIELAAPGGEGALGIYSTWSNEAALRCTSNYQTIGGGSYCDASGTSMSAAVATGAAALVWSVRPDLTAEQVRAILTDSARPISGSATEVGHGLVDAERAVRYALRSQLIVSPAALSYRLPTGSAPFTRKLLLTNPSLEPMQWAITRTQQIPWLSPNEPVSGTVRYGQPVRAALTISPTHVLSGTYRSSFWVEGNRLDGGRVVIPVEASLEVYTPTWTSEVYLPSLANAAQQGSGWPLVDFTWEWPDSSGRTRHFLIDNSSIGITLPLTITTGGVSYVDAHIYSDGAVALPATARIQQPGNRCLPLAATSGPAVFGWWADLNPGAAGGQVSSFQAGPDRFVVEFLDVRSAAGQPSYTVSFQIVLYMDGRIGLNYLRAPDAAPAPSGGSPQGAAPPWVTAGIQTQDGRFFNQLACVTSAIEVGSVPHAYQSMLFKEGDLF